MSWLLEFGRRVRGEEEDLCSCDSVQSSSVVLEDRRQEQP